LGNSAEAPKDPEEANFPEKEKIHEPLNFSRELIKRTANLIVDDRSAFLYLINLINLIKSKENAELETTLIERTLNLMRARSNRSLVSHFFKHPATTRIEIEKTTGLDEVSISQKLKTLKSIGFIEKKGRVGPPYKSRTDRGAGVPLWGIAKGTLFEAKPHDYVDAQRRYGNLVLATVDVTTTRQSQLPEAIAFCKLYMDKLDIKTIPEKTLLIPMLKAKGIWVDHSLLIKELKQDGYTW